MIQRQEWKQNQTLKVTAWLIFYREDSQSQAYLGQSVLESGIGEKGLWPLLIDPLVIQYNIGCPLMLYPNLLLTWQTESNQVLSKLWTRFRVSCITSILHRGSRIRGENVRLQYSLRITDANRAEIYGDLPPPHGDETACDRCWASDSLPWICIRRKQSEIWARWD
jgi:hypothetical protein